MATSMIQLSSCHHCNSDVWVAGDKSSGTYKCNNCGKVVDVVLKKKKGEKK